MRKREKSIRTALFALVLLLGGAAIAQTPGEFPQGANIPKNMRPYFLCLLEKGERWTPMQFRGSGDAGAHGVHSRAGGSGEVRGGGTGARSRTDWWDGDHQCGVDRRGEEDCERGQDDTKRADDSRDSSGDVGGPIGSAY